MISKYLLVQIAVYLFEFAIFALGLAYLSSDSDIVLLNAAAKCVALLVAFFMHKYWTFEKGGSGAVFDELGRYLLLFAFNLALSSGLTWIFLVVDFWPQAAKILADTICVIVTYYLTKNYIFNFKAE